jgi:hypothetical protein
MKEIWQRFKTFIGNDSMSIALFSLFIICIAAQSLSGWLSYNQSLHAGHFPELAFGAYLRTGNFLDGVCSNWQAAILQLAVLVAFSSVLRQKGAAHSREMNTPNHRTIDWKIGLRPTPHEWLYANSLSLAFSAIFAVVFLLHLLFGEWKYNEDQALRHLPATSLAMYAGSSGFWFSVFQCWEAEFWAIAVYIVLSIFLRQENSSESKPVGASNEMTGEVNK